MRTALDKLLTALTEEETKKIYCDLFEFSYNGFIIVYLGPIWCIVNSYDDESYESEYIWKDYSEMLDFVFPETKKSMREMLIELSELDIKICQK
jgi:hypothetical protein